MSAPSTAKSPGAAGGSGPTGFGDIFASSKVQLRRVGAPSGGAGGAPKMIEKKTATIRRGTQAVTSPPSGPAAATSPSKAELDQQRERERRAREEADQAAKAQKAAEERARAEREAAERLRQEQARKAADEERRLAQEERARQEARAAAERAAEERVRAAASAERERVQREERAQLEKQRKAAEADRARQEEEARRRAAANAEAQRREQAAAAERAARAEQEASRARQIALERAAAAAAAVAEAPAGTSSGGSRGFCTRCGQPLRGTTVELDTKEVIHQTCFKCERCSCALTDSYFNVDGQALCEKCAKSNDHASSNDSGGSAPNCQVCHRKVSGEYLVIDGAPRHRQCLTCQDCRRELLPANFSGEVSLHRWANEPGHFCDACFNKRNDADKCDMCERPLGAGTFLTVMSKRLHPTCLRCRSCNAHVAKDRIFQKAGWPACEQCGE
jgi:hypothetical protein